MRLRYTIMLTFVLALAACGGGRAHSGGPHYGGIVTAKIAPKGTVECNGGGLCSNTYDFSVWIEPMPGHDNTGYGGWYEQRSLVCVSPSYWRILHIGSHFDTNRLGNDLHCDG